MGFHFSPRASLIHIPVVVQMTARRRSLPGRAASNVLSSCAFRMSGLRRRFSLTRTTAAGFTTKSLIGTARPGEASALFLDHVALALNAHVAPVYGGMNTPRSIHRGGCLLWFSRHSQKTSQHCDNEPRAGCSQIDRAARVHLEAAYLYRQKRGESGQVSCRDLQMCNTLM